MGSNRSKISILSDIYAIGSILFRMLFGIPPPAMIADQIDSFRLQK
jgi:serine/threonine protein kinase